MLLLTLTHIHSQTQTKLMPTNSPILPFLVLTMAGGCGVSNLMKQAGEQQLSVCGSEVRGGLKGVGGGVKTQVSLSKQDPDRESAALTTTTDQKWLPGKETAASQCSVGPLLW